MIAAQTLRNIERSMSRLDEYNRRLSTGKQIGLPSDDPTGTELTLRLRRALVEGERYIENIDAAIAWINMTEAALGQATSAMQRARELAVAGATGTNTADSFTALAAEVEQILDDLVQVGNSKFGERYLFGGTNTLTAPFELIRNQDGTVSVEYKGAPDDQEGTASLYREIGPGDALRVGVHGDTALKPAIDALIELRDALRKGDPEAISSGSAAGGEESVLHKIDRAMEGLLTARSEAGARYNRLELARQRLEETQLSLKQLDSLRTDVDLAETIMHLKMEEYVYQSALASGARTLQVSLVDFLR